MGAFGCRPLKPCAFEMYLLLMDVNRFLRMIRLLTDPMDNPNIYKCAAHSRDLFYSREMKDALGTHAIHGEFRILALVEFINRWRL